MKAVICPVCNGLGKIGKNPDIKFTGGHFSMIADILNTTTCHGCGGKGWVEVSEEPKKPLVDDS